MLTHYLIAGTAFLGLFVLFLVISRTLNATINHLMKLHYLIQKELDIKKERLEINKLLEEEKAKAIREESSETNDTGGQQDASSTQST